METSGSIGHQSLLTVAETCAHVRGLQPACPLAVCVGPPLEGGGGEGRTRERAWVEEGESLYCFD